jgi:CO/xanthine dehydrogenase Mo-binding subunit
MRRSWRSGCRAGRSAIGNAVSHALGARIRDLPMTRERIMATLLAG